MGNCLDRALSDQEDMIGSSSSSISPGDDTQSLINSTSQLASNGHTSHQQHQQRRRRSHRHHTYHNSNNSSRSHGGMSSLAMPINQRVQANSTFMQSFSLPAQQNRLTIPINNTGLSSSLQQYANSNQQQQQQFYYLTPNVQRTADQLTEEDQIKLLKRMALIQQLPSGSFDDSKKNKECVICMVDFELNDTIKYLPCMHTFHSGCIDSWLVRSLYCPSCMESVDAGLLSAFDND